MDTYRENNQTFALGVNVQNNMWNTTNKRWKYSTRRFHQL